MGLGGLFILATGLAMDATAVAAARGVSAPRLSPRHVLLLALAFGGSQALMPAAGWLLGAQLSSGGVVFGQLVAVALLLGIGGKMLWDAAQGQEGPGGPSAFCPKAILLLAIATSIDAFGAGISLPLLQLPLLSSVAVIGLVTAALSALGALAGHYLGLRLGGRLDALGGLALILIAARIFFSELALPGGARALAPSHEHPSDRPGRDPEPWPWHLPLHGGGGGRHRQAGAGRRLHPARHRAVL